MKKCQQKLSLNLNKKISQNLNPQPKKNIDNTSRYIALLRDGLIGKDDFLKLTTDTNNKQVEQTPIYQ